MNDETIWRYMDFTKFADLITTKEVFFCRSDLLGDPFEGSCPQKHHERRIEEIRRQATAFQKEISLYVINGLEYRKSVYINCWHMSEHESAALWRLYLKSDEGIAIRSTRNRLGASFSNFDPGVWSVPVQYIDYLIDDPPVPTRMAPFRYKRKSFEHERELRAIVYADIQTVDGIIQAPPSCQGIRIKTDINQLIDSVFLAPTAPDWVYDLTLRLCKEFKIEADVVRSSLAGDDALFI